MYSVNTSGPFFASKNETEGVLSETCTEQSISILNLQIFRKFSRAIFEKKIWQKFWKYKNWEHFGPFLKISPTKHLKSCFPDFLPFTKFSRHEFEKISLPFWNFFLPEIFFKCFKNYLSYLENFALKAYKNRYELKLYVSI